MSHTCSLQAVAGRFLGADGQQPSERVTSPSDYKLLPSFLGETSVNARRWWYSLAWLVGISALVGWAAEKDLSGDPLPEGAQARLGTARFRMTNFALPILAPDGKSLYVQSQRGLIRISPTTGETLGKVPGQFLGTPQAFSADGQRALQLAFDNITVWNIQTGKSLVKIQRSAPNFELGATLSADGKRLAIGSVNNVGKNEKLTVLIWDVENDKEIQKITVPQNQLVNAVISGDGRIVATWGSHFDPEMMMPPDPATNPNRFVHFWDATTGKELSKVAVEGFSPAAVAFHPDGSLAAVSAANGIIELVDPKTGQVKQQLLGRSRMGRFLDFSPDGSVLAASGEDGTVQRWKTSDGSRLSTTESPVPNLPGCRVRALSNDKALAYAMKGIVMYVWEIPSGKLFSPEGGHAGPVRSVAVTADNQHVITSAEDGLKKWELKTGKPVGEVKLQQPNFGFTGPIDAVLFAPNLKFALMRDSGGFAVYDLTTGLQEYVLPTPFNTNATAKFTADGQKVVITSWSFNAKQTPARVQVWDVATAKRFASLELPNYNALSADLTPDGKFLVTAGRKVSPPDDSGVINEKNNKFIITTWNAATGQTTGEFTDKSGFANPFVTAAPDNKSALVATLQGGLVIYDLTTAKVTKTLDLSRNSVGLAPVFSPDGKKFAVACQSVFMPDNPAKIFLFDWPGTTLKQTFTTTGGTPMAMTFSPDGQWLVTGSPDTTATVWAIKP
jgi:WD40 repeat protein